MMIAVTPSDLARHFPSIAWCETISVVWPDTQLFACRVCIALRGLRLDSPWQWPEKAEAERHIRGHMQ